MRFKWEGDHLRFFLSSREVDKYGGAKHGLSQQDNVIKDNDMPFKIAPGLYEISVNGKPVVLEVTLGGEQSRYKAFIKANGLPFEIEKIKEITKYDLYRGLLQVFTEVVH